MGNTAGVNWDSLSIEERHEIRNRAIDTHDKANRQTCHWCGAPIIFGDCDHTMETKPLRRAICKDYCKGIPYFHMRVSEDEVPDGTTTYCLSVPKVAFSGKKPVSVSFGETSITVSTWNGLFEEVLHHCMKKNYNIDRLLALRGKLAWKCKVILSESPEGMAKPLELCEEMYIETNYDVQTLMHILTERVLSKLDIRLSEIKVTFCDASDEHEGLSECLQDRFNSFLDSLSKDEQAALINHINSSEAVKL